MKKSASLILALLVMTTSGVLLAAPVAITNGDFETPVTSTFTTGSITGWNHVSGSGSSFGVTRLTTSSISPASIDGSQVAYLREGTGVFGQTLGINLTANTTYTLSIWIGQRSDIAFGGYTFGLFAGGTALVSETNAVTPAVGAWANRTLSFTALAGDPNLGLPVEIRFGETNASGVSQTVFDSVGLDASPVPEPSTYALIATGLFALRGILRRRR